MSYQGPCASRLFQATGMSHVSPRSRFGPSRRVQIQTHCSEPASQTQSSAPTAPMAILKKSFNKAKAQPKAKASSHKRVAAPKRTGNADLDSQNELQHDMLNQMIDDLIQAPQHITYLYNELQKRKRAGAGTSSVAPEAETLECATSLMKVDEDFKLAWVLGHSDLKDSECVELVKCDQHALDYLVQLATQIGFKTKLPECLKTREVMKRLWDARSIQCGDRLKKLKASGGITAQWEINFLKVGGYQLHFGENGLLAEIEHSATRTRVPVPTAAKVDKSYALVDNFDDMGAHLLLKPLPPLYLHVFFDAKNKQGPHSVPMFVGRPKDMAKLAQNTFEAWEKDTLMMKGMAHSSALGALSDHYQEKNKEAMSKAREQAREALAVKKARRTIAIT